MPLSTLSKKGYNIVPSLLQKSFQKYNTRAFVKYIFHNINDTPRTSPVTMSHQNHNAKYPLELKILVNCAPFHDVTPLPNNNVEKKKVRKNDGNELNPAGGGLYSQPQRRAGLFSLLI